MYDKDILESFSTLVGRQQAGVPHPSVFSQTYLIRKESDSFKKALETLFSPSDNDQSADTDTFGISRVFKAEFEKDEMEACCLLKEPAFWSGQVMVLLGESSAKMYKKLVGAPEHFYYRLVVMSIQIIIQNKPGLDANSKELKDIIIKDTEKALLGLENDDRARDMLAKLFSQIWKRFKAKPDDFKGFEVIDFETIAKNGCEVDQCVCHGNQAEGRA